MSSVTNRGKFPIHRYIFHGKKTLDNKCTNVQFHRRYNIYESCYRNSYVFVPVCVAYDVQYGFRSDTAGQT